MFPSSGGKRENKQAFPEPHQGAHQLAPVALHNPGGSHSPGIPWESCPLEFCAKQWLARDQIINMCQDFGVFKRGKVKLFSVSSLRIFPITWPGQIRMSSCKQNE